MVKFNGVKRWKQHGVRLTLYKVYKDKKQSQHTFSLSSSPVDKGETWEKKALFPLTDFRTTVPFLVNEGFKPDKNSQEIVVILLLWCAVRTCCFGISVVIYM